MISVNETNQANWLKGLSVDQRSLVNQAMVMLKREKEGLGMEGVVDYGFLIYPVAKAYEGFLKEFFSRMGFLSAEEAESDHFRIGKALNPDLPKKYRDEGWVYDDLVRAGGMVLAEKLWMAWRAGRNRVFHYHRDGRGWLSLGEAEARVGWLMEAMRDACEFEKRKFRK